MTSSRPYLIRALYEWITDNNMTPHLLVDADAEGVMVPQEHVHEGRIVLNINPSAVQGLMLGNDWIKFNARFGGTPRSLEFPLVAVMAVYARESGQGMAFGHEPGGGPEPDGPSPDKPLDEISLIESDKNKKDSGSESNHKRPTLKIVK